MKRWTKQQNKRHIPGITMTRLSHTDSEQQREWENIIVNYTTLKHASKSGKVLKTALDNNNNNKHTIVMAQ